MITLLKADAISAEKIATLEPSFAVRVQAWLNDCRAAGILPYIYEGLRSNERQAALYAQGRTTPGKIVTNAQPGQSFHNYGRAFDWVPLVVVEKAEGMFEAGWDAEVLYRIGTQVGMEHQLRALSWETPHLEDATVANWRELAKGEA